MTSSNYPSVAGYQIQRVIGHGGMSTVYIAEQTSLERRVALKIMLPEALADEVSRARFENEARIIARLEHPNIVGIFEVGRTADGLPFYSMPYLPHGHLAQRNLIGDQPKVAAIMRSLLQALDYAHVRGVVHRDVKAENVLFDDSDRPMLADFGIALRRGNNPRLTNAGLAVGSTAYMPPEQARGQEVDRRADIYSMGVLAWEMLMGQLPFNAGDALTMAIKHVQDPIPRLPSALKHWQPFIDKAMAKQPELRFASANDMQQALDALEQQSGKAFTAVELPNTTGARKFSLPNSRTLISAGAVTAIAIAVGFALFQQQQPEAPTTPSPVTTQTDRPSPQPSAAAPSTVEDIPLEATDKDQKEPLGIAAYLANAQQQLSHGQLLTPANANAWNSLKAAWKADPTYPETLKLTAQLFDALADASVAALRNGDMNTAISNFQHAQQLDARRGGTGAAITTLRKRLDSVLDERLDKLLARAETRPAATKLVSDLVWLDLPEARLRALRARTAKTPSSTAPTPASVAAHTPAQPTAPLEVQSVSRLEYAQFANATGRSFSNCGKGFLGRTLKWSNTGSDRKPVVCISAADAQAYATWRGAQDGHSYRLPSAGEASTHASSTSWLNLCNDHACKQRMASNKPQPLDATRGYDDVSLLLVRTH